LDTDKAKILNTLFIVGYKVNDDLTTA